MNSDDWAVERAAELRATGADPDATPVVRLGAAGMVVVVRRRDGSEERLPDGTGGAPPRLEGSWSMGLARLMAAHCPYCLGPASAFSVRSGYLRWTCAKACNP